ncbi:CoA transferase subunit A [Paenibacillus psychroresistens]|uniref:CoA transferase subunit A n=1 Tax=Paenibacillus psychroresistens TaxID=1778678 RepID=UPI001391D797|nr:CoA transferase subunit A [Paenibacillus psychroresistens]
MIKLSVPFIGISEAVSLINNRAVIAVSGNMDMSPMAIIREIIRSELKQLHLLCSGSVAINADILIGAGIIDTIELSHITLGEFGFAPHYRRAAENGIVKTLDHSCPGFAAGLQAAVMGLPFMSVQGMLGTDYLKVRADFKVISNPFPPYQDIVLVPPIQPDVSIFHAYQADRSGNVIVNKMQNNRVLAQASKQVIVSVEEIVEVGHLNHSLGTLVPSQYITAIVEAPYGAYPTSCTPYYSMDRDYILKYVEASKSTEAFERYLHENIITYSNYTDYIHRFIRQESCYDI